LPIRIIGATAAKVQPWTIGSRLPTRAPKPMVWISVAAPQVNRSALIRKMSCS
jgi:hypothetical protein